MRPGNFDVFLKNHAIPDMNMTDIHIEELIPHRERMKLIRRVMLSDEKKAVTEALVTEQWPLFEDGAVSSIVLIELLAQTAAVCIGWQEKQKDDGKGGGKGWLVGIKKARFFTDKIPLNTRITTTSVNHFVMDNYVGISGKAEIGSETAGEIDLQVFWVEE